ncbi:hypothetical protein Tco_1449579 [Tanacetum coccineum]
MIVRCFLVLISLAPDYDHPLSGTWNNKPELVGKIQVVLVDRLWEHIPIVGLMVTDMVKHDVEIETLGECVDEIDKLAELIGKHEDVQIGSVKSLTNLTSVTNLLHSSGRSCLMNLVLLETVQWHSVRWVISLS